MDTLPLVAPEQVGLSAQRLDRVRKWMSGWVDSGRLAGMVTVVMRRGELAFTGGRPEPQLFCQTLRKLGLGEPSAIEGDVNQAMQVRSASWEQAPTLVEVAALGVRQDRNQKERLRNRELVGRRAVQEAPSGEADVGEEVSVALRLVGQDPLQVLPHQEAGYADVPA